MICNCHKVSERMLVEAIGNGADSVEALCTATRAGTGCGSCKTELAQLITTLRKPTPALDAAS